MFFVYLSAASDGDCWLVSEPAYHYVFIPCFVGFYNFDLVDMESLVPCFGEIFEEEEFSVPPFSGSAFWKELMYKPPIWTNYCNYICCWKLNVIPWCDSLNYAFFG